MKQLIEEKWEEILNYLAEEFDVSKIIIDTWIRSLSVYDVEDKIIYFYVDETLGDSCINYLKKKGYDGYLLTAIRSTLSDPEIDIIISKKNEIVKNSSDEKDSDFSNESRYKRAVKASNLNPQYTFENFIVGDSNKHAYATCVAVADLPAQDNFNPLFIYGGSGLGKTHLIQSIAHYILKNDPDCKVLYVSSETFTNEIIKAIHNNQTEEFRSKYREVDVLIIDDIQELIGRESTQQEFFNTFNYLYDSNKQIILSSDRPPKEIKSLDERLRSRFEWGVPIDIHAPDYETRMAILKAKKKLYNFKDIDEDILIYIAHNVVSNVRELEGALNKINIYSKLNGGEPVTLDLAKEALKDLISKDTKVAITPELILNIVSDHMNISVTDIQSTKRSQDIAIARQLVMYLSRQFTDKTLQTIGDVVGGKNHATVVSGINRIEKKISEDEGFKSVVEVLIKKIDPKK